MYFISVKLVYDCELWNENLENSDLKAKNIATTALYESWLS
jgi:hypothetical protein